MLWGPEVGSRGAGYVGDEFSAVRAQSLHEPTFA